MGYLYGESHRASAGKTEEYPCGRLYKTDGGRLLRTQVSYHRHVDKEHDDARQLCQDRGNTQLDNQVKLFRLCHRTTFADVGKKIFVFFFRNVVIT